ASGSDPLASRIEVLRAAAREIGPAAFPESEEPPAPKALVEEASREGGDPHGKLRRTGDALLADALVSIAYAKEIDVEDDAAPSRGGLGQRHLSGTRPWDPPGERTAPGQKWHVEGSLLGLDLGLARVQLQRLDPEMPTRPPGLDSRGRLGFAQGAVLLNAFDLDDASRDAIAAAIGRGRTRVRSLRPHPQALHTPAPH